MPKFLRVFLCLLCFFALSFSQNLARAQDDDLDLEGEDSAQFDDVEQKSETPAQEAPSPSAQAPDAAPSTPAESDDLDLDAAEDSKADSKDGSKTAEEPPPPTIEDEKQAEEEAPVEPEQEPEQKEDVASPSAPFDQVPEPAEQEPEQEPAEQLAEPTQPKDQESPVFRSEYDTPDEEYETRLSRIYKQFYSNRTSDAEWTEIVGPKASERYTVQTGDTLWGVSQTFFGNGFFWPKLWQLNSDYTNPHILEIGDTIQFSPGSTAKEPTINLTQRPSKFNEGDAPRAMVTPEQAKAYMANVQVPPPLPHRPVIDIPGSLPRYENSEKGYDKDGFSIEKVKRFTISDIGPLGASVSEGVPTNVGKIVETETGDTQVGLYEEAVLSLNHAKTGDHFYSFMVGDRINNPYGRGYPSEYQGEFEVVEDLGDGKYRALCIQTITPVTVGSLLRPGSLPKVNLGKTGPAGKAEVKVFGGHYDSDRQNLGAGNIIYIDGGKSIGLEPGQLLTVLKNYNLRVPNTLKKTPEEPIGLIKVIDVSGSVATAYVLESRDDLRPGDVTGPGDIY